jgi:hypothetical protein
MLCVKKLHRKGLAQKPVRNPFIPFNAWQIKKSHLFSSAIDFLSSFNYVLQFPSVYFFPVHRNSREVCPLTDFVLD